MMTPFLKLSSAGFAATAITYGPARMGFGLFLPEFRSAFSISTQAAGLVASLGFFGLFAGLLIAQVMTNRGGPRLPVATGLVTATVGLGLVALAPGVTVLSTGIFLAMSSAGFAWTPFNNATHREVADAPRPAALSIISTGTSLGIALAGGAALLASLAGLSWRFCWSAFALCSAVALMVNWIGLREVSGTAGPGTAQRWTVLLRKPAAPLFGIAFWFGATSAIYISFAADHIAQAGGVDGLSAGASASLVFICYGFFGLIGLATGNARTTLGLPWLLRLLMLASALSHALLALMPTTWAGVAASAGLQGMHVMMTSATLAFWSDRLFPSLPSQSFTAAILAVAAGSMIGPAAAGFVSEMFGPAPMFLVVSAIAAATAASFRGASISERPALE